MFNKISKFSNMGRKKDDGRGRLGGRAKGTPNKDNAVIKEWISQLISNNMEQMEQDLQELEPKERLSMLEKMMGYVVPKQAAIQAESNVNVREVPQISEEEIKTELERLRALRNE